MPSISRLPALTAVLTLLALSACSKSEEPATKPAAPPAFTVNLSPPIKVGQKFSYTVDMSQESKQDVSISGPGMTIPPQNQDSKSAAHLEGEAEVLAVNAKGGIQKVAVRVKALTATEDGKAVAGLPGAGAKIVGERKGKDTTVTIDDKPASDEITAAIGDALPLDDDLYTDQELSGPTKPVAVGDSWPVNTSALADQFKQEMETDISDLKGTMKLDSLKGSGDDQVAAVSGSFSGTIKPPGLPPTATLDSATASGTISGHYPATATKGTLTITDALTRKFDAHGAQQGMQITISMTDEQKRSASAAYHP